MKYLLDTHLWLWLDSCPNELPKSCLKILEEPSHKIYLSSISCWEIVIKSQLGKLKLSKAPEDLFESWSREYDALHLPFTYKHTSPLKHLSGTHKDPFDRALVAQAQVEQFYFMTVDKHLADCSPNVILI